MKRQDIDLSDFGDDMFKLPNPPPKRILNEDVTATEFEVVLFKSIVIGLCFVGIWLLI